MSGAQVVPIFAFGKQSDIATLLPKLNGVLFPGKILSKNRRRVINLGYKE
jgi:hypothetical protein